MQVEDINILRPQSPKAVLDVAADALWCQTFNPSAVAIGHGAALREDQDSVALALECLPNQLFGTAPAIEGRGIDPIDATIQGGVDRVDGRPFVLRPPRDTPRWGRANWRRTNAHRRNPKVTLT